MNHEAHEDLTNLQRWIAANEWCAFGDLLLAGMTLWDAAMAGHWVTPISGRAAGILWTCLPSRAVGTLDNPVARA